MDRDRILLTPGPLTTTLRTKLAMLKDWGSWDADFNALTAGVRSRLLDIVHGHDTHVVVPLQGSGTFSVEAAVATVVPRGGHVLVMDNGAYGTIRMHQEREYPGRVASTDLANPDFAALARAYGGHGESVLTTEDFAPAFERAVASGKPSILHVKVDPEAITPAATLSGLRSAAQAKK